MSEGARISLDVAKRLGERCLAVMAPHCLIVAVAGSVRRKRSEVGDLEMLCIPNDELDLLGQVAGNRFDLAVGPLLTEKSSWVKNGPKYKQLEVQLPHDIRFKIDIFTATTETWPVQFAIRTGPAHFSKQIVTPRSRGGRLLDGYHVKDGRLWSNESLASHADDAVWDQHAETIELRDERHFLETFCGGWVEPEDR